MNQARKWDWCYAALLASACCMGFSVPAGRLLLAAATVLLIVAAARGRRPIRMPLSGWLWLVFAGLAVVITLNGVNPAKGLNRLDKLAWFAGIPVAASIVDSRERLWQTLRALLLGLGVLAVRVCVRNVIVAQAVAGHSLTSPPHVSFGQALIDQGTLIDGQRLMLGLIGAVALTLGAQAHARMGARRLRLTLERDAQPAGGLTVSPWALLIGALALAELVALKRGSWFCTLALLGLLLARRLPWRYLLAGALLLAALALGVSPVRQRLALLRTELSSKYGGRVTMWTQIAPQLMREHPWGIGFRSLTNDMMRDAARKVGCRRLERNRDHLHSNPVEMAVSLGWLGLAFYLVWMAVVLRDAAATGAAPRPLLWMVAAILLNGLVEYNFADAEIVIILGLLGGLAAAGRRLSCIKTQNVEESLRTKNRLTRTATRAANE
ncbi:MAG: O-antigen ligase family protein [Kiritimatiellae bacterium]|nr:O-antigen ligase family protein [Kiritimatiellia bacterium]